MSRAWVVIKRIGRLLRFAFFCLVLSVIIFFVWRVFSTDIPKELKSLTPNEKLNEVYAQKGEDLYVFTQKYDPITRAERNSGYFSVPTAVFIPDANQAQIVFRYNNSTLNSLATDYGLETVPSREEELFDVTLVLYIDLTPENKTDTYDENNEDIKTVTVHASAKTAEKSTLYNFYRYVFEFDKADEPVDVAKLIEDGSLIYVQTHIYYNGDIDYAEPAYGAIRIYDARVDKDRVKLTKADKKIFEKE